MDTMDLMRCKNATWEPDLLIEGWTSLIWTERYRPEGSFEMRSPLALNLREKIPEDSLVCIRQSREMMLVEDWAIDEDGEDGPEWVTTGRSVIAPWTEHRNTTMITSTPGAASAVTSFAGDNQWPSSEVVTLLTAHMTSLYDVREEIPGLAGTTNLVTHVGTVKTFEHPPGPLYDEIWRLLAMEDAGLRSQRPLNATGALGFWLYSGLDRSAQQSTNAQCIFSVTADHIVDPSYLFTLRDYRNVAYVYSPLWNERVYAPGVASSVSGRNRRILYVDASNEIKSGTDAQKSRKAQQVGLAALAKVNATKFFDGQIATTAPQIYGTDYYLGDKVTLLAEYGLSQTMQVGEYVRAEDREGFRAYPTLIQPAASA